MFPALVLLRRTRVVCRLKPYATASVSRFNSTASTMTHLPKNESEWRAVLSPEQFRVLRQKGTEMAGTGAYNKHYEPGVYECAGCHAPLYKSTTKFNSGCGWPAFFDAIPGAISRHDDFSFGMVRAADWFLTHPRNASKLRARTVAVISDTFSMAKDFPRPQTSGTV